MKRLPATRGRAPSEVAASRALLLILVLIAGSTAAAMQPGPLSAQEVKAREIFARLIAFRSTAREREVPALAEYLAGEFRAAGFPAADVRILPLADSASLVVRYRGDGSGGRPILLLSHMDVVAAKREDWKRDPFTLSEENGYFFGRGTYDVKTGVTALTSTFLRLRAEGFVPTRDLIIYFSGDEETAQFTTLDTARNHRELIDAEFALNTDAGGGTLDETTGEPLYYSLQTAESIYADFQLTARNAGGHSSYPRPDNAIYELAEALVRLRAVQFPVMWNETTLQNLRVAGEQTPGALGEALRRFAADPADTDAADALAREPAFVGQTRTTCVATMLAGGHAPNALPQSATATVNCRIFPGAKVESVQRVLQQVAGPGLEVTIAGEPIWSDASPLREDVVAAVTRAVQKVHPGVRVVPAQESGASDGAIFRSVGIPTYGVGEIFIKNSEIFSHGLDERIPVRSFYQGLEQWYVLLKDVAGRAAAKQARRSSSTNSGSTSGKTW